MGIQGGKAQGKPSRNLDTSKETELLTDHNTDLIQ